LSNNYSIVIPMAGLGTRMRPHTWSKPKSLIHLAGRTVLDFVIDQFHSLPKFNDAKFILILSPNQIEQVSDHIQANYSEKKVHYVLQKEMRGQSDALFLARDLLHGPILMAFSDTLIKTDLSFLDNESMDGIAWVKAVPDPRRFGVAKVDHHQQIKHLIEKPKDIQNNLAVVGFYYFQKAEDLIKAIQHQMKEEISLNGEYYLVDAINIMIQNGARMRIQQVDVWLDAGKPEALLETNRYLLENGQDNSQIVRQRNQNTVLPPVNIHPDAKVEESIIGPYVSIGESAVIQRSIIRNSIVEHGASISQEIIEDSIIGCRTILSGKPKTMNIGDDSWLEA